jgi:molecular chaperone GrpE
MSAKHAKGDADHGGKDASAKEIARLQQEIANLKDQHLRTLADVDNTKKRLQRDHEELRRFASETVVRQLLPLLDSLDQALASIHQHAKTEAVSQGIQLIHQQLVALLKQEGAERIQTIGARFDPHRHEAVGHVPASDEVPEHTIAEELQVGYAMHGKVLRPAMVKVARATTEDASSTSSAPPGTASTPQREEHDPRD